MPRIKVRTVLAPIEGAAQGAEAPAAGFALPPDGRQSDRALAIRRGVGRRLRSEGFAVIPELVLASGRRADIVAVGNTGEILIVEVKSSIEDYRADSKWSDYCAYADRFFFATGPHVPIGIFPEDVGLFVADLYGAELVREATPAKVAAATRKQMLIRLARAGMLRLHDLDDPDAAGM